MSEFVVLLGARLMGGSYLQEIHRAGMKAIVVDERDQIDRWKGRWDLAVTIAEDTPEAWLAGALEAAASVTVAGVIAYADEQVIAAAVVAEQLGLPGPGLFAAMASRDKSVIRSVNAFAGIPQPRALTAPFEGLDDLGGRDTAVVVQKVLSSAGSEGVRLVPKNEAPLPSNDTIILEEYVRGEYFSSEIFVVEGEIVFANHTSKTSGGPPEFVDLAHLVGVSVPVSVATAAAAMLDKLVDTFRIGSGIAHIEWIAVAEGRVAVIEFAVRTPGDFLMYGIERAHGFNSFEAVVQIALGRRPHPARHPYGRVAVSFFPVVLGDAGAARDLLESRWSGDDLFIGYWRDESSNPVLVSSDDRNHHVLLVAADQNAACRLAAEAQDALSELEGSCR